MKVIELTDYNRWAKTYWTVMVAAGALTGTWAIYYCLQFTAVEWVKFLTFLALVLIASSFPIRIPNTGATVTAGDSFTFISVIVLGVPAAVVLAIVDSFTSDKHATRKVTTWLGAPAMLACTHFITGNIFYLVLSSYSNVSAVPMYTRMLTLDQILVPLCAMALCQYVLNGLSLSAMMALKQGGGFWTYWRDVYLWTSWTFIGASVAAAVIYGAIGSFGFLYVIAGVPAIYATYGIYKIYLESLSEKSQAAAELGNLHLSTVEALATAIDAKDQTSHFHVRRVQIYAEGMGRVLGLSTSEIEALKSGALLHDIGKLAIPDHILNKPGRLTTAEFEKMKIHAVVGAEILGRVDFPYPVVPIVRHHHEQYNGLGYPDGLKGEDIPITARIISVVDCFDAVRDDRPYRRGMTRDEAIALLLRGAGTHFDPKIVDLFLKHLHRFEEEISARGLDHNTPSFESDAQKLSLLDIGTTSSSGSSLAYSHIKNANREIYALYEIARTFGSSLDIEDTLSIFVNKVGHIVPFDTCVVYLFDELKAYAVAAHVDGKNADLLKHRCVAPGEGVTGFALANRRPISRIDPALDFAGVDLGAACEYRAMASFPLVKDDRLLGALSLYSIELSEYSEDNMRLLETVTRLASDAIANAMHYAETQSHALTEPLTGLPNARSMYLRFDQEAARARRTGRPFQVVMMDLDNFKQVNDTYGHKVGDKMLREVARLLLAQLREYDFLARYAGDEFVAIVQDLVGEQVDELRERIEKVIVNFALHVRAEHHARVGISVGTATYGVDGETLDQLLIAADQAMYAAKSEHRTTAGKGPERVEILTGDLESIAVN